MCTYASFFPPYFSCPFCRFSTFVFFAVFFYFLYSFTKKAYAVCAKAEASIFFGSLAKLSKKLLNCWLKCERFKWTSGLSKDFGRQTKECMAVLCKYMRNNFTRQKGKKKLQLHNIKVSSKKVWRYMTSKGSKALKRKRRRTCRQGVRRIWKLYSKGRPAGKLTWCEPPRDHLDCRWQENIQRSSPQITGRAKAVTTPCLDTLWVLVHSITHHIENMWRKKDILVTDISVIQC